MANFIDMLKKVEFLFLLYLCFIVLKISVSLEVPAPVQPT